MSEELNGEMTSLERINMMSSRILDLESKIHILECHINEIIMILQKEGKRCY